MEKSNYALISALYSDSNCGLYSDIYFPIIKYALVGVFSKREESHLYCNTDVIHTYILEHFGISIPYIVISKSILKINAKKWGNVELKVYENGDYFQILNILLDNDYENIAEKEKIFTEKIEVIESTYKKFIEHEGSIDDGVTFIQFISDNTDDILGYFEKQDKSKVDERYTTLIFFLQYLCDYEKELYQVANQLFWGSVIAGFLKSEKPYVEECNNGIKSEYFLDTSIVMGILKLSTLPREIYSQEVCDIIKASGGILYVNPMTIDEISYILQSVEQNGANPLTDIASACERYKLEANELARIRLNLSIEIEKKGISVFPQMSPTDKQRKIQSLKGKRITKLLAESRNKKPASYSSDNYREIHDIFMDEYIKERREKKSNDKHVYFLTANRDLITFCKTMHPSDSYMKSTGEVILELWMYNTKPVDISSCLLTETMARCLDLHGTRVRNKIVEVSRLYNKTKNDFNADVYKDFIKKLYSRAKHVIQTVEVYPNDVVEGEFGRLIKEAVAADNLNYNKETAKIRNENTQLSESIASKEEEIRVKKKEVESLFNDNQKKQEEIINIRQNLDKLSFELANKENERKQIEKEKLIEITARFNAEQKISLYKRRDELKDIIIRIKTEIAPYMKSREKSFRNWLPYLLFIFSAFIVLVLFILWCIYYRYSESMIFFGNNKVIITSGMLTIAGLFITLGIHFNSKDSIEKRRIKAQLKWEAKDENIKYKTLHEDLSRYNAELRSVENELSN